MFHDDVLTACSRRIGILFSEMCHCRSSGRAQGLELDRYQTRPFTRMSNPEYKSPRMPSEKTKTMIVVNWYMAYVNV